MSWAKKGFVIAMKGNGGSGGGKITEDIVTNKDDGNLPAGTLIPAGTDLTSYAKMRGINDLHPIINITNPSITLYEKGEIPSITFSGTAQKTDTDIKKIEIYKGNELIDTILNNTIFSHIFNDISNNVILKAIAYDETNTGEGSKQITFVYPSYYGIESNLIKVLQISKESIRNYTFTNDKAIYRYPKSFGALTKITDGSGVTDYTNSFEKTVIEIDNIEYYNYKLIDSTSISNFSFKFM